MHIGVPTEIKNREYRVAITPAGVHELVSHGHTVSVQRGAGEGSAIADDEYLAAGASLVEVEDVWSMADMVLKVKEPIASEYRYLRPDLILFTYLHLAADRPLTAALIEAGTTAIAYETVRAADGSLPLLAPMSEVAGRLSVVTGSYFLLRSQGGRGVLASGVPGVSPANVLVIGGGIAGENAMRQAVALGADVTVVDLSIPRLREIDRIYQGRVATVASSAFAIEKAALKADLIIGAVLIPGAKAPKLISHELVERLKPGSVLVDIAIDQGGCFEDSRPTTHDDPTFTVANSVFYCVANMPGAVPATSTAALTNATLPYVVRLANDGGKAAVAADPALASGLNVADGVIINSDVSHTFPDLPSVL